MLKKILLNFLFVFVCISSVYATPASDLAQLLNNIHSMRANFIQTIYDNRNRVIQQSYGQMMIERPGKFRWQVKKPIPQLIIANQTRLWIYDPDLQQVSIRALKNQTNETPALLLSNVNNVLEKDFTVKNISNSNSVLRWFQLMPKQADNMFASIQMGFQNQQLQEMKLEDHLGHVTRIQFKNSEINPTLAANIFTFKVPPNVDVIDETKRR